MRGALEDPASSGLEDKEKALLRFVHQLNAAPATVATADIAALHAVGWNDEAIYDAVGVCALFNFYNRWVDGAGIHHTPVEVYEASGKRLATGGYSRDEPPK